MEKRKLVCIGCPLGCPITVEMNGQQIISVSGNTCPRGEAYARKEVTNPTRIVTSTVRVSGSKVGAVTVSCKTRTDISKQKIFDVIRDLKSITVPAPIHIGDVIIPNAAATGVDIVATKNIS
ncbi:MAG: DUF1667 domain-containing protein [Oscillospiraceae bacterium]|nr:DUF1667 domain-containing protein [Oscillospiraceae bacterium]